MYAEASFNDMARALKHPDPIAQPSLNITLLRNIMLEPVEIPLRYFARLSGFNAHITFGHFDTLFQDSLNKTLITRDTHIVFLATPLLAFSPRLSQAFCALISRRTAAGKRFFDGHCTHHPGQH
jgi:hypothetical protein